MKTSLLKNQYFHLFGLLGNIFLAIFSSIDSKKCIFFNIPDYIKPAFERKLHILISDSNLSLNPEIHDLHTIGPEGNLRFKF